MLYLIFGLITLLYEWVLDLAVPKRSNLTFWVKSRASPPAALFANFDRDCKWIIPPMREGLKRPFSAEPGGGDWGRRRRRREGFAAVAKLQIRNEILFKLCLGAPIRCPPPPPHHRRSRKVTHSYEFEWNYPREFIRVSKMIFLFSRLITIENISPGNMLLNLNEGKPFKVSHLNAFNCHGTIIYRREVF